MERSGVLPTTQFAYRKGLGICDALLCVSHALQSVLERGQEARIVRLISAQPLIGSTIREFCISSVMWVLEVLCCLYWHSFYQIDHSMLWLTVVGVNWLTSCQECRRAAFWAHYCSSYTPLSLFSILENKLIGYADDSTLIAVVPSPGLRVVVAESLSCDLVKVNEWCDL